VLEFVLYVGILGSASSSLCLVGRAGMWYLGPVVGSAMCHGVGASHGGISVAFACQVD